MRIHTRCVYCGARSYCIDIRGQVFGSDLRALCAYPVRVPGSYCMRVPGSDLHVVEVVVLRGVLGVVLAKGPHQDERDQACSTRGMLKRKHSACTCGEVRAFERPQFWGTLEQVPGKPGRIGAAK